MTPCYPGENGGCWVCGNSGTEPCQYPEMPDEFHTIAVMLAQKGYSNPSQDHAIAYIEIYGTSRQKSLVNNCWREVRKAFDKLQKDLGQQTLF